MVRYKYGESGGGSFAPLQSQCTVGKLIYLLFTFIVHEQLPHKSTGHGMKRRRLECATICVATWDSSTCRDVESSNVPNAAPSS